jgi:hypothetical protein
MCFFFDNTTDSLHPRNHIMCLVLWLRRLKQPLVRVDFVKQLLHALYDAPINGRAFYVTSQLVTLGERTRTLLVELLRLVDNMCVKGSDVGFERDVAASVFGPALCHIKVDVRYDGQVGMRKEYHFAVAGFSVLLE